MPGEVMWSREAVKQLLTGYYNRPDVEADDVIASWEAAKRLGEAPAGLEQQALDSVSASVRQGNRWPEQSLARAQVFATLAVARAQRDTNELLGELLGDDTGLDRLQQRLTNALFGLDGTSVATAITRAGGR